MVVVLEDLAAECQEEAWEVLDLEEVLAGDEVDLEAENHLAVAGVEEGLVVEEAEEEEVGVGLRWEDLAAVVEDMERLMSSRCAGCLSELPRMILQR